MAALSTGRRYFGIELEQNIARWRVNGSRFLSGILLSRGMPSPALFQPASPIHSQRSCWIACAGGSAIASITNSLRRCDRQWCVSENDDAERSRGSHGSLPCDLRIFECVRDISWPMEELLRLPPDFSVPHRTRRQWEHDRVSRHKRRLPMKTRVPARDELDGNSAGTKR